MPHLNSIDETTKISIFLELDENVGVDKALAKAFERVRVQIAKACVFDEEQKICDVVRFGHLLACGALETEQSGQSQRQLLNLGILGGDEGEDEMDGFKFRQLRTNLKVRSQAQDRRQAVLFNVGVTRGQQLHQEGQGTALYQVVFQLID